MGTIHDLYKTEAYETGKLRGKLLLANHALEMQAAENNRLEAQLAMAKDLLLLWLRAGDDIDAIYESTVNWLRKMEANK